MIWSETLIGCAVNIGAISFNADMHKFPILASNWLYVRETVQKYKSVPEFPYIIQITLAWLGSYPLFQYFSVNLL